MDFGDVVKYAVLILHKNGEKLNFHRRKGWHNAFYQLKTSPHICGAPAVLREAFFDWDGPYPVCQELNECLNSFVVTGCVCCSSPNFNDHWLDERVAVIWQERYDLLLPEEKTFFETAMFECLRKELARVAIGAGVAA